MTPLVALDDRTFVAGQIAADDMKELVAARVTLVISNRPDGEEPGQPFGEDLRRAADAAGLAFRDIPVAGAISTDQIEEMAMALDQAEGKVLAFCRSGTRSTWLWALARASRGADVETLIVQAAAVGYDLTPLRAYVRTS